VVTLETEGKRHELGARGYAYLSEVFPPSGRQEKRRVASLKSLRAVEKPSRTSAVSNEDAVSSHASMAIPITVSACCRRAQFDLR